jgi:hypothetical protein
LVILVLDPYWREPWVILLMVPLYWITINIHIGSILDPFVKMDPWGKNMGKMIAEKDSQLIP